MRAWLFLWWWELSSHFQARPKPSIPRRRRPAGLKVETLEDRLAPANVIGAAIGYEAGLDVSNDDVTELHAPETTSHVQHHRRRA